MVQSDEEDLLERCRGGDGDRAFAELVDRYKDLVHGLIYRMIRDRTLAEDLAQDAFLKIHRGLPYFRGEAKLSTWIYRIVLNVCSQERARRRVPEVPLDPGGERAPLDPPSTDTSFSTLELRDRLDKAMATLPDNYRFLIAAHYLRGVQYDALAEALGIPMGTVKTHLHRAKRLLRERLDTEAQR